MSIMSIKNKLKEYNGELVNSPITYDGIEYNYVATFNNDQDIDAFIEDVEVSKCHRKFIEKKLTLFFSVFERIRR